MIIDIHVHLIGLREENGCMVGKKLLRGPAYHILTRALGLTGVPREKLDDAYADRLIAWAKLSGLDGLGILAFDGVYDEHGEMDTQRTQFLVGNDYCLDVCERSPLLFPICSVNPQRKDAIEELERVAARGAVAIKTLPNSQGFDPGNEAYTAFWQKMADLGLPLLTHTSFEHTIPPIDQAFGKPERLRLPLEQGVTVIAAHCAGAGTAHPFREDFDTWLAMLEEHENLWGDISAMASISRYQYIHRVLASELACERVVMGSDFPVPANPIVFWRQLGWAEVRRLAKFDNPFERNYEVFKALGVSDAIMKRGAELLGLA